MVIQYKKPSAYLANLVSHFWEKHHPPHQTLGYETETVLPETYTNLTFSLGAPYFRATEKNKTFEKLHTPQLATLHTERNYYKHHTNNHIFGIKFLPGGLYPFVAQDFVELTDATLDLDLIFSAEIHFLAEALYEASDFEHRVALVEAFLLEQLQDRKLKKFSFVKSATSFLLTKNAHADIALLAEHMNSNYKSLSRIFYEVIGISPKQFAQMHRFERALHLLSSEYELNCTEIGYRAGYYDQAHFIREFKKYAGQTPTAYLEQIGVAAPEAERIDYKQFFSPEHLLFYQLELF